MLLYGHIGLHRWLFIEWIACDIFFLSFSLYLRVNWFSNEMSFSVSNYWTDTIPTRITFTYIWFHLCALYQTFHIENGKNWNCIIAMQKKWRLLCLVWARINCVFVCIRKGFVMINWLESNLCYIRLNFFLSKQNHKFEINWTWRSAPLIESGNNINTIFYLLLLLLLSFWHFQKTSYILLCPHISSFALESNKEREREKMLWLSTIHK